MSKLQFTPDHEWLRTEDDGSVVIGITEYAQEQLGDIVYVELPESEAQIARGENLVVIESVKAVGEVAMPLSGTVTAVNDALGEAPETLNADPQGEGWIVKIVPLADETREDLMDEAGYRDYIAGL